MMCTQGRREEDSKNVNHSCVERLMPSERKTGQCVGTLERYEDVQLTRITADFQSQKHSI